MVPCPTEEAFFEQVGLKWVSPAERTAEKAEALYRALFRRLSQKEEGVRA